jgi:hypothetical protein
LIGDNSHISWSFHLNNEADEQLYIDPLMKDFLSSSFIERKEDFALYRERENYSFPILEVSSSLVDKDHYCRDVINILDSSIQSVAFVNDYRHLFLCSDVSSHRNLLKSLWFLNQAKDQQDVEESMKKNGNAGMNVIYSLNEQGQVGMVQKKRLILPFSYFFFIFIFTSFSSLILQ